MLSKVTSIFLNGHRAVVSFPVQSTKRHCAKRSRSRAECHRNSWGTGSSLSSVETTLRDGKLVAAFRRHLCLPTTTFYACHGVKKTRRP